ncbi:MAG: hypothetical protein ACYCOU_02410 [Sulfobacillus sp.]
MKSLTCPTSLSYPTSLSSWLALDELHRRGKSFSEATGYAPVAQSEKDALELTCPDDDRLLWSKPDARTILLTMHVKRLVDREFPEALGIYGLWLEYGNHFLPRVAFENNKYIQMGLKKGDLISAVVADIERAKNERYQLQLQLQLQLEFSFHLPPIHPSWTDTAAEAARAAAALTVEERRPELLHHLEENCRTGDRGWEPVWQFLKGKYLMYHRGRAPEELSRSKLS